jgi:ABC-type uncharacterized transport system involved in gliding motility auxiliary subunit
MKTDPTSARASRRSAGMHGLVTLVLFAVILVAINILGFKYYYHRDWSQSQFYTLSPKTVDVLKHLDSPVTVTTVFSSKIQQQYQQQIENLLEEYERVAGKNFTVTKIDPAYDIARASDLQKRLQFDGTENLVIFEYKGRSRFVKQDDLYEMNPMTQQVGVFKGEQQLTAALVALVEGKASKVYFTEGHGEASTQDMDSAQGYGILAASLKNENVETLNLNLAAKGEVPADADAVVIAGPVVSFSPVEVQALDHYLAANRKLFILLDPYVTLGMDDLLKRYGLRFDNDLVLYRALTTTGQEVTVSLALIYQGGFSSHPITAKFAQSNLQLQLTGARSITMLPDEKGQPNPKIQFLLQTDANSWGWVRKPNEPMPADPRSLTFNRATDVPGPVTVAAEYDGGMVTDPKTQALEPAARIVVVGSSKFVRNDVADTVGLNFFSNCVDWLVKKQAVLDISPKIPQQYGLSLSPMQARTVGWMALFFIPGAALILAVFTWLSRRK